MKHFDALQIANAESRRGEKVIWADRPGPGARAMSQLPRSFFGVFFFIFSIVWMSVAYSPNEPLLFPLFGIPFMLIGLAFILTPVWAWFEARKWLVYALTDQRILIIRLFPRHKVETFAPRDVGKLERTTKADGSGNLIFREDISHTREGGTIRTPRGFFGIRDVKNVEAAVHTFAYGPDDPEP